MADSTSVNPQITDLTAEKTPLNTQVTDVAKESDSEVEERDGTEDVA